MELLIKNRLFEMVKAVDRFLSRSECENRFNRAKDLPSLTAAEMDLIVQVSDCKLPRSQFSSITPEAISRLLTQEFSKPQMMEDVRCFLNTILGNKAAKGMTQIDRQRLHEFFSGLHIIGAESVWGIAARSDLSFKESLFTHHQVSNAMVIKAPRDTSSEKARLGLVHEAAVAILGTNKLRARCPFYSYVYNTFNCGAAVVYNKDIDGWCDTDSNKNVSYVAYEMVNPNNSIDAYLKDKPEDLLIILFQVAMALHLGAEIGFSHNDLHTENVMIRLSQTPVFINTEGVPNNYLESGCYRVRKTSDDGIVTMIDYGYSSIIIPQDNGLVTLYPDNTPSKIYNGIIPVYYPANDLFHFLGFCTYVLVTKYLPRYEKRMDNDILENDIMMSPCRKSFEVLRDVFSLMFRQIDGPVPTSQLGKELGENFVQIPMPIFIKYMMINRDNYYYLPHKSWCPEEQYMPFMGFIDLDMGKLVLEMNNLAIEVMKMDPLLYKTESHNPLLGISGKVTPFGLYDVMITNLHDPGIPTMATTFLKVFSSQMWNYAQDLTTRANTVYTNFKKNLVHFKPKTVTGNSDRSSKALALISSLIEEIMSLITHYRAVDYITRSDEFRVGDTATYQGIEGRVVNVQPLQVNFGGDIQDISSGLLPGLGQCLVWDLKNIGVWKPQMKDSISEIQSSGLVDHLIYLMTQTYQLLLQHKVADKNIAAGTRFEYNQEDYLLLSSFTLNVKNSMGQDLMLDSSDLTWEGPELQLSPGSRVKSQSTGNDYTITDTSQVRLLAYRDTVTFLMANPNLIKVKAKASTSKRIIEMLSFLDDQVPDLKNKIGTNYTPPPYLFTSKIVLKEYETLDSLWPSLPLINEPLEETLTFHPPDSMNVD